MPQLRQNKIGAGDKARTEVLRQAHEKGQLVELATKAPGIRPGAAI